MKTLRKLSKKQLRELLDRLWEYQTPDSDFSGYHRRTRMIGRVSSEYCRRIGL